MASFGSRARHAVAILVLTVTGLALVTATSSSAGPSLASAAPPADRGSVQGHITDERGRPLDRVVVTLEEAVGDGAWYQGRHR